MNVFSKVFGTRSQREVKRIMPLVEKTESYQSQMQQLTDEQLRDKTREYKKRLAEGATLDDLLPEAFATVREAAKRVLGMEHYRVQIIGGIILHQGRIAEMKTGEGKTLVSTLPAYLNALEGKGVHIVTVNDYLAKRDAEWMGKVHEFLGLTVGVVLNDMKPEERRAAYGCDITYVTNNELGFDYLRDNMVIYKEQLVQRDLHYCIIDEIDSVLIDEARTPLIISGQSGKSTKLYEVCDILAQQLERGEASHEMTKMAAIMGEEVIETGDFVVNEKDKIVNLTEQGIKKVEKFFNIENLADPENLEIQHNIILALRAHNLMHKDQDYVVKDDEILIVDEALSVGDVFFQAKCYRKFEEFKEMGKTILFVSHDLSSIGKYCDRVVLLNKGEKLAEGGAKEMVNLYRRVLVNQYDDADLEENTDDAEEGQTTENQAAGADVSLKAHTGSGKAMKDSLNLNPKVLEYGSKLGEIVDFAIRDDTGMITNVIEKGKEFSVQMKVKFQADVSDPIFAFTLKDLKGTEITGTNTMYEHTPLKPQKAGDVREITFKQVMPLEAGEYMLCLGCTGYKDGDFTVFHRLYDVCNLTVITDKKAVGYFDLFSKVSVK